MKKQILVSGLRASSQPHIGNYLGAIRQFVDSQDKYDCLFFIADLHTLTTPYDPKELRQNTKEVIANYLALGLDPAKSALFLQSQISEHAELAWILETITPLGELYRMTQFKDKSGGAKKENINAGLLNYPVLMAADILLYKAEIVPVGEDQAQHLELARLIARKFNSRFGKTFPEPKALLNQSARVKSLMDPAKKMSKTGDEALMLSDSPEIIKKKLRKAVTASDAKGKSAGVENLFLLLKEFGQPAQYEYFEKERKKGTIKFSELKDVLADEIANYFAQFRERRAKLLDSPELLADALAIGAAKARQRAGETLREVKSKIGLL